METTETHLYCLPLLSKLPNLPLNLRIFRLSIVNYCWGPELCSKDDWGLVCDICQWSLSAGGFGLAFFDILLAWSCILNDLDIRVTMSFRPVSDNFRANLEYLSF